MWGSLRLAPIIKVSAAPTNSAIADIIVNASGWQTTRPITLKTKQEFLYCLIKGEVVLSKGFGALGFVTLSRKHPENCLCSCQRHWMQKHSLPNWRCHRYTKLIIAMCECTNYTLVYDTLLSTHFENMRTAIG